MTQDLSATKTVNHGSPKLLISAVICTYERYDLLADAIESLLRQNIGSDSFEIIVVDNSPDLKRSRVVSRRWKKVGNLVWHHESAPGLSRARNAGIELAQAPLVAFLDDDAVAVPGWLASVVEAFDGLGSSAQVIGGRVRLRFETERPDWLDDRMLGLLSACDLGDTLRLIGPDEWVVGANVSYRAAAVRAAGGFSPTLGRVGSGASLMSNEETELQTRIAAMGGSVGYAPMAEVEHFVPASRLCQSWFRKRLAWQAISDYVRAPDALQGDADASWRRAKHFLASCKPSDRTLRGLAIFEPSPERFHWQTSAVYDTVVSVLAGLGESHEA